MTCRKIAYAYGVTLFAVLLWAPGRTFGYQVDSQFSNPCHESISVSVYNDLLDEIDVSDVPVPTSTVWRKLAKHIAEALNLENLTPQEELILVSLVIGTRAPDTKGHSVANFVQLRNIHLGPEDQYNHALRTPDDDYAAGDVNAVNGTRAWIKEQVDHVAASLLRPSGEQIIQVDFFLDFYGRFKVDVWEPVFRLGVAAHALQDSFTHMIRSADTTRVYSVTNYADPVNGEENEERDGFAHSDSLDDCSETGPVRELARSAKAATAELYDAIRDELRMGVDGAVDAVLDKWLTLEPGCTLANNYCDSPWLEPARIKQSGPYLCHHGDQPITDPWGQVGLPWAVILVGLLVRALYQRRRSRPTTGRIA